jgi:hypothetical protein
LGLGVRWYPLLLAAPVHNTLQDGGSRAATDCRPMHLAETTRTPGVFRPSGLVITLSSNPVGATRNRVGRAARRSPAFGRLRVGLADAIVARYAELRNPCGTARFGSRIQTATL